MYLKLKTGLSFIVLLMTVAPLWAQAPTLYLAQAAAGSANGSSCANALTATYFNSSGNWGTGATQIGSGTTIHLCGAISTTLTAPTSQGTGLITVLWESGAKMSAQANQNFFVIQNSSNAWLFNGGFLCGPQPTGVVTCNGVIENTSNGTNLSNQTFPVKAFDLTGTSGRVEITGLDIRNLYVHVPPVSLTNITTNGSTTGTLTCATTCGFVAGEGPLTIAGSTVSAQNATVTVASTSGTSMTVTYSATVAAGTSTTGQIIDGIILNTSVNCVAGNPIRGNILIHDGDCHDVSWAFPVTQDSTTAAGTLVNIYDEDIYDTDHGPTLGGVNNNSNLVFMFHDSHWHNPNNWDTGALNAYHHDGFHFFNSPTQAQGVYIYNNLFDGPMDGNVTSFMFNQESLANTFLFNNVVICNFSLGCQNVPPLHEGGGGLNELFVNNTFIGTGQSRLTPPFNQSNNSCVQQVVGSPATSGNATLMNNLLTGCNTMIDNQGAVYAANSATSGLDYNIYANYITDGNAEWNWNSSIGGSTTNNFSTWQSLSGEGSHSMAVANANLNALGYPMIGSPAVGTGTNLSSLCAGNLLPLCKTSSLGNSVVPVARPTTGAWTIGALPMDAPRLNLANPVCGLTNDFSNHVPNATTWANFSPPAVGGTYGTTGDDAIYGCTVTRLTNAATDGLGAGEAQYYATASAGSANDTYLMVFDQTGSWHIIATGATTGNSTFIGHSGQVIIDRAHMPTPTNHSHPIFDLAQDNVFWVATSPNVLKQCTITGTLNSFNCVPSHTFTEYAYDIQFTNMSNMTPGGWLSLAGQNTQGSTIDFFVYNPTLNVKSPTYTCCTSDLATSDQPDNMHGVTPFINEFEEVDDQNRGNPCQNNVWVNAAGAPYNGVPDSDHGDLGYDLNGNIVQLYEDYSGNNGGCPGGAGPFSPCPDSFRPTGVKYSTTGIPVVDATSPFCMFDTLSSLGYSERGYHVSYRDGTVRPWILYSTQTSAQCGNCNWARYNSNIDSSYAAPSTSNWQPGDEELLLVRVDAANNPAKIYRLALQHTRGVLAGYWADARAAISPTGNYIYFTSNSAYASTGNVSACSGQPPCTDVYMVSGPNQTPLFPSLSSAPAVSLSPTSLTFPAQLVGKPAAQTVTLSNTGTASLSISSITVTGTNASDYGESDNCDGTVNAGAFCTITITFTPAFIGTRTATVSITDNAAGSPQTVPMTGTANGNITGVGSISGTGTIIVQP